MSKIKSSLIPLRYGDVVYFMLKDEFHPRKAYYSYDYADILVISQNDLDDTDEMETEIPFEKIDSILSQEEYEEMIQPAVSYKVGDRFNGPNEITFRIVAIYNNKYAILIRRRDGAKVWSFTTEYRIKKLAIKVA